MDIETFVVPFHHEEHGTHHVTIEVRELDDDYYLTCSLPGTSEIVTATESDAFSALQILRRKTEGKLWMICCMGSRQNVWPSAMSRDMGGGFKAYILLPGKQATDLVYVFDPDTPEYYSTVADQEAYSRSWFASLGS